jgi:iron complex outermembrane receptor protein
LSRRENRLSCARPDDEHSMKTLPIAAHTAALAFAISSSLALAEPTRVADLADYSLEQLANLKVTTVSRREERLVDAPASPTRCWC